MKPKQTPDQQPLAACPVANKWFLIIGGRIAGNWQLLHIHDLSHVQRNHEQPLSWKEEGCAVGKNIVGCDWLNQFNEIGQGEIFQIAPSFSHLSLLSAS